MAEARGPWCADYFFHGAVDVPDRVLIARDDMEVGADLDAAIADGVGNILEVIDGELLGDDVDDLVAGGNIGRVLIGHQLIDLLSGDLFFRVLANDVPAGLETFDMMPGDTYIDLADVEIGVGRIAIVQRHADGLDRLVDIEDLPVFDAIGVSAAEPQYFQLTVLVLATGYGSDLCRSDVEPDDYRLFVIHSLSFSCFNDY